VLLAKRYKVIGTIAALSSAMLIVSQIFNFAPPSGQDMRSLISHVEALHDEYQNARRTENSSHAVGAWKIATIPKSNVTDGGMFVLIYGMNKEDCLSFLTSGIDARINLEKIEVNDGRLITPITPQRALKKCDLPSNNLSLLMIKT